MEKIVRRWRRLWGILGALCLIIGCLSGCGGAMPQETERRGITETAGVSVEETKGSEELGTPKSSADSTEIPEAVSENSTDSKNAPEAASENSTDSKNAPKAVSGSGADSKDAWGAVGESGAGSKAETEESPELSVDESGSYTGKDEVALYIHLYGHLPDNYITKREAENLGWNSKEGNLWEVAPGMSMGGSRFGNYEGLLPDKKGRQYYECDIDFDGGYRGAKRIIYSDDGLIFYTEDHYKTFQQLYGE